ncbi:MAG: Type 1 glutamine amidotransferase-like domain-containing protein [Patescibacteria group bacterium]|nr:Type 1 glutamine amidotransferase-like domain-containing protein [Patescibacteria group bacterium]
MKTKFIIHGGYAGRSNSENDKFYKEILKDVPNSTKILLVYFAKEKDAYQQMEKEDTFLFNKNKENKKISFEIATKESFVEQINKSDVIFLHGGKTPKLINILKECPDFRELIDGKVVAGESAGAYALSSCYYSKSEKGLFEGLGFVPVKIICHYVGENEEKLDECPKKLERILLKDYQYKVYLLDKFEHRPLVGARISKCFI